MNIKVEYLDEIVIFHILGEIDMGNADSFINKILEIKGKSEKIIFDFSRVDFIDSTGIGKLIKFFQDHESLKYVIINVQPDIKEIFQILNLAEILGPNIFIDSDQEAVNILRR